MCIVQYMFYHPTAPRGVQIVTQIEYKNPTLYCIVISTVNSQSGVIFSLLIRKAWWLVLLSIPLIFCNLTHPVCLSKYFWTWKNAQQNLTPKEIRDIFCSAL